MPPTQFTEYVTTRLGGASKVRFASDDGFASADPLTSPSEILYNGEATDSGPTDHGALFDLGFGVLAAGASTTFTIFYGAAGAEDEAINALALARAEIYSLGQPSTAEGPSLGIPNTFIFGPREWAAHQLGPLPLPA